MTTRANAVITVHQYRPAAYDESAEGPVLTRIHVEELQRRHRRRWRGRVPAGGAQACNVRLPW
jgi:hypothetical protein